LAGGGKKAPYAPLASLVTEKVRKLILIGEIPGRLLGSWANTRRNERAGDMRDAVNAGFKSATSGDVVLLAPACASFDMFESFEHRGKVFKEAVRSLSHEIKTQIGSRQSAIGYQN